MKSESFLSIRGSPTWFQNQAKATYFRNTHFNICNQNSQVVSSIYKV
jgi:hypothetical protein